MKKSAIKFINRIAVIAVAAILCVTAAIITADSRGVAYAVDNSVVTLYETYDGDGTDFSGTGVYQIPSNYDWRYYLTSVTNEFTGVKFVMQKDYTSDGEFPITTGGKNYVLNLDLNGHYIRNQQVIEHAGRTLILDGAGGGEGSFVLSTYTAIEYRGSDSTVCEFYVDANHKYLTGELPTSPLLIYGGKVSKIVNNGSSKKEIKLTAYLPAGYAFVSDSGEKIPYETVSKVNGFSGSATFTSVKTEHLTTALCDHDSVTSGKCDYCNATVDGFEALETAKREIAALQEQLDATKEELATTKDQLTATTNSLNTAKTELETAQSDITTNAEGIAKNATDIATNAENIAKNSQALSTAMQDVDDQLNTIKDTLNGSDGVNAKIAALEAQLNNTADSALKTALQDQIDGLKTSVTDVNTSVANITKEGGLIDQAVAAEKTARETAVKAVQDNLDTAYAELTKSIGDNTKSIDAVKSDVAALQGAIKTLNDTIATVATKDELSQAVAKEEQARQDAFNSLSNSLTSATKSLGDNIAENAGNIATIQGDIENMQKSTTALEAVSALLNDPDADASANPLAQAIKTAIATAKQQALNGAAASINDALEGFKNSSAFTGKADTSYVNEKVNELNNAITALRTTSEAFATTEQMNEAIAAEAAARNEAIAAVKTALEEADRNLTAAVNAKADAATVTSEINRLDSAIANLKVASGLFDQNDAAAMKAELEAEINAAKNTLQTAIDSLSARLTDAETKISANEEKIADNEKAIENLHMFNYIVIGIVFVLAATIIVTLVLTKFAAKASIGKK